MMNQTKKHTTGKKLLALLLALIMTVSLLPMSVFAAEPGTEAPIVEGQTQPAAETGEDDAEQAQEPDADEADEGEEDAVMPGDEQDAEDAALTEEGEEDGVSVYAAEDEIAVQAATDGELTFTTKNSFSYVALTNNNTDALPTDSTLCRAVMLDCGRKYFTVAQIKTLIDYMSDYGYNQLQLSFGNGGCRLLLDDMDLTYVDSKLTTTYLQEQIKAGNAAFNGDTSCLTQEQMTDIIGYANGKHIEIVPMLNMPGHAKAIDYVISRETDDILNTSDNTVREFAFALLKKYVDYFKGQGCKYFHFGSDESKESGTSMSTFLASCANIIANAGLRPRAFNDETNLGTEALPNFVQITYWISYGSNNSKSASALSKAGYQLINTHGNWYYVVNDGAAEAGKSVKYTSGVRIELPTLKKAGSIYGSTWPQTEYNFYDNVYGQGSNVTGDNYKGTMFCIWCDNSTGVPGDAIISKETYGALTQLKALAELYWPNEIPATEAPNVTTADGTAVPATMTTGGSVALKADKTVDWTTSDSNVIKLLSAENADSQTITGTTVTAVAVSAGTATIKAEDPDTKKATSFKITVQAATTPEEVNLTVGESKSFTNIDSSVEAGEKITGNAAYIATAKVEKVNAVEKTTVSTSNATALEDGASYILCVYNSNYALTSDVGGTDWGTSTLAFQHYTTGSVADNNVWTLEKSGDNYKLKCGDQYLSLGGDVNNAARMEAAGEVFTIESTTTGWTIKNNAKTPRYINALGGLTNYYTAGGWTGDDTRFNLYKVTKETPASTTLTITGTGEGNTEVTVGNTKYIIEVTAPTKTETKTVAPNGTTTLQPEVPEDGSVTYTLSTEDNTANVTLDASTGVVTASETTGTATVTAVVKNAGEKVVARYTYTITVSDIDWSTVEPLPVELWVTNLPIGQDENSNTKKWNDLSVSKTGQTTYCTPASIKLQPKDIYAAGGEAGVELLSQVIAEGVAFDGDGKVKTYNNEPIKYVYWKGVVLQNRLKQYHGNSNQSHDDCSDKGVDFQMIRYTTDGWQYYANNTWNFVKDDDTLIAYYMQKFVVSDEVITTTRDWGDIAGDGGATDSDAFNWAAPATGYFGVGYAVVYSDKSMSPSTEQGIWNETLQMRYCYDPAVKSSDPGYILAYDTENYKITKVTITRGYHADSNGNQITAPKRIWNKDEQVLWNKIMNDAGDPWYDETVIWDAATGTRNDHNAIVLDPTIWGDTWVTKDKNNEAFLILFYVEEVQKDTNLKLVYWDDNAKQQINPKEIQISVNDGVTFTNGLRDGSGKVIGDKGLWNSADKNSNDYLPDDAYIINSVDRPQQFNKNITILEGVAANYRSGIYEYVSADISSDGKTLTLHYKLKNAATKTYVVDFGLTVNITGLKALFNNVSMSPGDYMSLASANELTDSKGNYGHAVIDTTTWDSMTYTLFRMIDSEVQIPLYLNIKQGSGEYVQQSTFINVIPASNVYYEDSFVTCVDGAADGSTAVNAKWTLAEDGKAPTNPQQALEELGGDSTNKNVYGYDPAYDDCTMFSMGSAKKVTVDSSVTVNPTATFTFRGTGFDVISLTDSRSGAIIVNVKGTDANTSSYNKNFLVDNYYGYKYNAASSSWEIVKDDSDTLYQIPVMKVTDLAYGTYDVTITVAYGAIFDHDNTPGYSFWMDAVRVYNPMGDKFDYTGDGEGYPQYIEIRNQLIDKGSFGEGTGGAVFIDGTTEANVEAYKNGGPNNEVYLLNTQAIAFQLANIDNVAKVQIGAKAPMGSATLTVNGTEVKPLGTATEMYYDITDAVQDGKPVIITNGSTENSSILSLTQLKITYKENPSTSSGAELSILTAKQQQEVVQMVRAMYAPAPEPDPEPFAPERFEASWNRSTVKVGQKATLTVKTSEDVDAITVDGVTIDTYRTRTQRTGWGWNAKRVTYREFTYTITAKEAGTLNCSVAAVNGENVASEPITAALTVQAAAQRPSWGGWLGNLFGRWF